MQLYKSRSFGEFFSDTFSFVKKNGKHFFKHYFTICGIPILVLMVFSYFFMKFYTDFIQSSVYQLDQADYIVNYANENASIFAIFGLLFFLIAIFVGLINFSYTPIYLNLYEEHKGDGFATKEIINSYKKNAGKIIIYMFASILIAIPVFIIAGIAMFILLVTIIGSPLLIMVFALISLFYHNAFIEYLQTKKGVFECFGYSLNLCFKKFWSAVGSVALFYFMIQIVQGIVFIIPYFIGIFTIIIDTQNNGSSGEESMTAIMTLIVFVYILSFLVGIVSTTILQLNQGIVFFSLKEENENINTKTIIDQIGTSTDPYE